MVILATIPARAQPPDETIRVATELTAVEITVSDRDGKPVRGLGASDFRLFEDGERRDISFFEPVRRENFNRPLAVVFALDVSGSMTPAELLLLRDALRRFVKRLADRDSYFALIKFGMDVETIQEFTNKPEKLERAYEKLIRSDDGLSTHAYDATDAAVRLLAKRSPKMMKNRFPKRAVILVTDGFPVGDTVSPSTVIERANEAETTVYSVIVPSYSRLQGNKKPLPTLIETSGLIEKTGGRSFYVNDDNFDKLFESLAVEVTSSYVLAFYPESETKGREAHEIRVEAVNGFQIKQNRTRFQRIAKDRKSDAIRQ
ncbi:MAG: VWA domain-containing protein [Acidobacteria bacterium]|nr:VWA domain-containing protein [Acidobacteriota bacterium]MBK8810278.1 VWA domain-containing protein [Acidobacteriota bacterium]